jgi:hypothetical protein
LKRTKLSGQTAFFSIGRKALILARELPTLLGLTDQTSSQLPQGQLWDAFIPGSNGDAQRRWPLGCMKKRVSSVSNKTEATMQMKHGSRSGKWSIWLGIRGSVCLLGWLVWTWCAGRWNRQQVILASEEV